MSIALKHITAPTPEAVTLVTALDAELGAQCTPEQRHGLALDAIFQPHIRFFLAEVEKEVVGCGGVALFDGFAEVKRMYVRQDRRGHGVADAIMARLVAEARRAGFAVLRLETGAHFHRAIAFYRRHGFVACPIFEPYASLPTRTVVASLFMEKRLAGPGEGE
jgi:putative acetyltransferase